MTERPLTVAQLAERWVSSVPEIMALIESGKLPAFSISSNGRLSPNSARITEAAITAYGETPLVAELVGMVYLITCGRHTKIGFTSANGVGRRLGALQSANPERLDLWATIPGTMRLETELHERFRKFRGRGEWFAFDGDARAELAAIVKMRGGKFFGE